MNRGESGCEQAGRQSGAHLPYPSILFLPWRPPPQHWILRMKRSSLALGLKWQAKEFFCLWTCDLNSRKYVSLPRGCGGNWESMVGGSGLPSGSPICCCLETQSQGLVRWSLISGHWLLGDNKGIKGKLWSGSEFVSWELHGQATVTVRARWSYPLLDHQGAR